jgi:membrane-bound lytic murein transglycosylase D
MPVRKIIVLVMVCLLSGILDVSSAVAGPQQRRTHPDFTVPPKLRARVDFWIDVFTHYGKAQMIIHHREYPQVRFGVIDLTREAVGLSDDDLDRLKKARTAQEVQALQAIFRNLAAGASPRNDYEQHVVDIMSFLPGGPKKFKKVLDEDLIRTQSGIREKYMEALKRSGRYLPIMQQIFHDYDLPIELTRLPFIESSFDYRAYSSVGAAGIWQFMRRTGARYLKVNSIIDERRDPIEATKAAARYLNEAYGKLGTWPLAITSYNHGVAGVARKVREAGTSNLVDIIEDPNDRAFGFASTNFFPEFLAALEVYDDYHRYFPSLVLESPLDLTEIKLTQATSAKYISQKLKIDIEDLRAVNYAVSERVWSGRNSLPPGYALKVPSKSNLTMASLRVPQKEIPQTAKAASAIYSGVSYKVRKGDTLANIAKRHRISVASLKSQNNLSSNTVTVGQTLIIKQSASVGAERDVGTAEAAPKRRTYKVQRGENLWSVAKKFGKNVSQLKQANGMKKNVLREGQILAIP